MVFEARKQSMAWMETDYSKHRYFQWKVKWQLEHLGAVGTMGEMVSLTKLLLADQRDLYKAPRILLSLGSSESNKHYTNYCLNLPVKFI